MLEIENPINFLRKKFLDVENQFDLERSLIKNLNILEQIEGKVFPATSLSLQISERSEERVNERMNKGMNETKKAMSGERVLF